MCGHYVVRGLTCGVLLVLWAWLRCCCCHRYIRSEFAAEYTRVYQGLATSAQVGGLQPSTTYDM